MTSPWNHCWRGTTLIESASSDFSAVVSVIGWSYWRFMWVCPVCRFRRPHKAHHRENEEVPYTAIFSIRILFVYEYDSIIDSLLFFSWKEMIKNADVVDLWVREENKTTQTYCRRYQQTRFQRRTYICPQNNGFGLPYVIRASSLVALLLSSLLLCHLLSHHLPHIPCSLLYICFATCNISNVSNSRAWYMIRNTQQFVYNNPLVSFEYTSTSDPVSWLEANYDSRRPWSSLRK